jgi:benzoate membrane transport protein
MRVESHVPRRSLTDLLPVEPVAAALPAVMFGLAAISIPITTAEAFGLSQGQTASLIIGLFGIPGIACLVLARIYRQPLLMAWHVNGLVFITALSVQYTYPEVLGGMLVAGLLVLALGASGLSVKLAQLIPTPVVFGIVAGTVMPFVIRVFSEMNVYPLLIAASVGTFVLARRWSPTHIPPILPAILVGFGLTFLLGEFGSVPTSWTFPTPELTLPALSVPAIVSIAPVMAIFIAVQSNLTTAIVLRSQAYDSPHRLANAISGGGTSLGSLLGAVPISTGSAVIALLAGPEAGEHRKRYISVYVCGVAWLLIAAGAGMVTLLPLIIPLSLLLAFAGIALFGPLTQALQEVTKGPIRVGPIFAFVVASSQLSLFGLGPLFWALIVGVVATLILEREDYLAVRTG